MRVIGVLDAPRIALAESVVDLQRYFRIREIRQVAELSLGDAAHGVGNHAGMLLRVLIRCGGGDRVLRGVGGGVVETDLAPDIERLLQRSAGLGRMTKNVGTFVPDVAPFVARLD